MKVFSVGYVLLKNVHCKRVPDYLDDIEEPALMAFIAFRPVSNSSPRFFNTGL